MNGAGGAGEDSTYIDKQQVQYAKDPTILQKYFKGKPDELNAALEHLGTTLNNTKHVDDFVIAELHIEERSRSHDPLDFRCSPKWTVFSAKLKIAEQFTFVKGSLFVLYKRTIMKDWMYLRECGVKQNGDVLYVYIHFPHIPKPKAVMRPGNISRQREIGAEGQSPTSSTRSINIIPEDFNNIRLKQHQILAGNFGLGRSQLVVTPPPDIEDVTMGELWTCKNCTFLNEPWRPGCVMCSSEKPGNENLPIAPAETEILQVVTIPEIATAAGNTEQGEINMESEPQGQKTTDVGWRCPSCTYLNKPTETECSMCTAPRTEDYQVPENCDLSEVVTMPENASIGGNTEQGEIKIESELQSHRRTVVGWRCPSCTYLNEPTRPGCLMCTVPRPEDYQVPENYELSETEKERIEKEMKAEEEAAKQRSLERKINYERHISAIDQNIVQSAEPVECMICFTEVDPVDTIVLRECLHRFCKECMTGHIVNSEEAVITCPYADDNYHCAYSVTEREIRALLNEDQFQKYLERGLSQAEKASPNSFHCKTPDCTSWCEYEDMVNTFYCRVCGKTNCLTCKAIHEGKNCKQYQDEMQLKAATDKEAMETRKLFEKMVKDGEAMHCPQCNIIIQKKVGCDWVRCSMCRLEICWVTKGPRWGPKGKGDVSGGCHCKENGRKCHKDCNNCH